MSEQATTVFKIDPEFHNLIPPLTDQEFEQLEANVLEEGCRDALVIWYEEGLLLDGHNRYNICSANDLPFEVQELSLPSRADALNWIIDNQLGRRNLTPEQASYLRGRRYNAEKADPYARPGNDNRATERGDQNDPREKTAERLATQYGVSAPTIKRDAQFAASVDAFEPDTRSEILSGQGGYSKQEVIEARGQQEKLKPHVSNNSGNNEWYTPAEYIDAARQVMGGIDLDPASSKTANEVIQAEHIYSVRDDGLMQVWQGRVWLNPPYSLDLIKQFADKLITHLQNGDVSEAIVLVNNATETNWFQTMARHAQSVCFPRGRVKFWAPGKERASPLQGQALLYFGPNAELFDVAFEKFGIVLWQ